MWVPSPRFLRLSESLDWRAGTSLVILLLAPACGSGGGGGVSGIAPSITTEPTAQSTTVGLTATFTVMANGTAPLGYRWSKNGTAVSGATSASFTTPAAVPTDNQASFTVTVTNTMGSATSDAALLTVGARAPQTGDWRFQGMDIPAGVVAGSTDMWSLNGNYNVANFLGTPLETGLQVGWACGSPSPTNCVWSFWGFTAPKGITWPNTAYASDVLSNLETDLTAISASNVVITSLDLQPANQVFAASWMQASQAGGFEFASQTVSPSQLQAVATQQGEQSRVITAISFDAAGDAHVITYGWQSDRTTIYDNRVISATSNSDTIAAEITNLAAQGYIVTAMGGDPTNLLWLVGARVKGDTMSRPLEVVLQTGNHGQISPTVQAVWRTAGGTSPSFAVQFAEQ